MEILPLEFIDSYFDLDIIKQERPEFEVYTRFPEKKKSIPTVLSRCNG